MTSKNPQSISFWVESKRDEKDTDQAILEYLRFFFATILDKNEFLRKYDHPTRGTILAYEFEIEDIHEFKYMTRTYSLLLDFLYDRILNIPPIYDKFVKNVPKKLKKRFSTINGEKNWATIRIKMEPLDEIRNLFENYNRVYPKLFVNVFFEDLMDGYIGFFHDEFDMNAVFKDPANSNIGFEWLEKNGFEMPEWYIKDRSKWVLKQISRL